MTRVALVPGCLALRAAYASVEDPVAELRSAVAGALAWLGPDVEIVASEQGLRVAEELLRARERTAGAEQSVLVVLNGSACRTEKAPGHYDARAEAFDHRLGAALVAPDLTALADTDRALGEELWADLAALPRLTRLLGSAAPATVDYDAAPYGVQYWVLRWRL